MKVTLALLCKDEVQDAINRLAFDCHVQFGVSLDVRRIPPHISLKQPFEIGDTLEDMDVAVSKLENFALRLKPAEVSLGQPSCWDGVLHFPVVNNSWLQKAHAELNASLSWAPRSGQAEFDGPDYRFHLTVLRDNNPAEVERCWALAKQLHLGPFIPIKSALFAYFQREPRSEWEYLPIRTILFPT